MKVTKQEDAFSKLLSVASEFVHGKYLHLYCEDDNGNLCECCDRNLERHQRIGVTLKKWIDQNRELR